MSEMSYAEFVKMREAEEQNPQLIPRRDGVESPCPKWA
jgi:hypothetical protein